MPAAPERANARSAILDAAQRVAVRDGAGHVTLDAVAREAGVSKGGLLYNFPNKKALLVAMLERMVDRIDHELESYLEIHRDDRNAMVKTLLRAVDLKECVDPQVKMAVLAAGAEKPELLDPIRRVYRKWLDRIRAESTDLDRDLMVWFAMEGIVFTSMLNVCPLDGEERENLRRYLLRQVEG